MSTVEKEAEFQSSLVDHILCARPEASLPFAGMKLYQNNWIENAHRALAVSFPTVQKLLGEDNFRALARQACAQITKTQYDWGEWGFNGEFVTLVNDFLNEQQVETLDYVVDCAQLDETIFISQKAADPEVNQESFGVLSSEHAADARLIIASSAFIQKFRYPVEKIYKYTHFGEGNITQLRSSISTKQNAFVQISRSAFKAEVASVTQEEYDLFNDVKNGHPISHLFDKANELNIDFSEWLSNGINKALIVKAELNNK